MSESLRTSELSFESSGLTAARKVAILRESLIDFSFCASGTLNVVWRRGSPPLVTFVRTRIALYTSGRRWVTKDRTARFRSSLDLPQVHCGAGCACLGGFLSMLVPLITKYLIIAWSLCEILGLFFYCMVAMVNTCVIPFPIAVLVLGVTSEPRQFGQRCTIAFDVSRNSKTAPHGLNGESS